MDVEIRRQVDEAIDEADLLLFVVDAKVGVHPSDSARRRDAARDAASRGCSSPTRSTTRAATDFYEFYQLGAGDPFPVSAQNGKNSGDLLDALVERIPEAPPEDEDALRVAVVGRPNVGKSSFVNRLLGEERLVVSRDRRHDARRDRHADDAITAATLIFVDTAGLRRQSQDRRRHRVLLVAAHAPRDRARRHLRPR